MKEEYKSFFKNLGYDVECSGAVLFSDLIEDVKELLRQGKNPDEIKKLLPRYYLEYYHFFYEISRARYLNELNGFCSSRVVTKNNLSTNQQIMNNQPNMNAEDSLIFFSNYFLQKEKDEKKESKTFFKIQEV